MRNRASHYAEADRLLENATNGWKSSADQRLLLAAIGHALLATASADVEDEVFTAEKAHRNSANLIAEHREGHPT